MSTLLRALTALLVVTVLAPASASAQPVGNAAAGARPYRGLFGGPGDPKMPQSLVFTGSIFGGYDDNVLAGLIGARRTGDRIQRSGWYGGATTALTYSINHIGDRVTFGAINIGEGAYYYTDRWNVAPYYRGAASAIFQLTRATTLRASYGLTISRYYRFLLFPDASAGAGVDLAPTDVDPGAGAALEDLDPSDPANADLDLARRLTFRHTAGLALTRRFGSRSTLSAAYRFRYIDFADRNRPGHQTQSASIDFNRRLTEHATLELGYAYTVAQWDAGISGNRTVQNINAGIHYARALSFSRHTTLAFSTGSAIVSSDNLSNPQVDPRTRVRAVGSASLLHEMGRSWTAALVYSRNVLFREGFATPFYADGVAATIVGVPARRVNVSAGGRWVLSRTDIRGNGNHQGATAFAQASYALNRFLAAYARYVYYSYRFGEGIPLDEDIPRNLDRQGVRVGLMTSVPLIR